MSGNDNFLARWSRRKSEARAPASQEPAPAAAPATAGGEAAVAAARTEKAPLPPVESLTPESDFSPFMSPEVDGDVRREALKTLFGDPRFNTMDMMDVYVDDYSKPDPLPASWLEKMEQVSRLGDRAGRDREEAERKARDEAGRKAHDEAEASAQAADPDLDPAPRVDPPPPAVDAPEDDHSPPPIPLEKIRDSDA